MVLWHLEVENQKPADIAPLLGMSANSVSALAYRAREGLRQAFLNMHSGDLVSDACRETNDLLGGYVRGALSRRDATKVEDHLEHCRRCTAVYLELSEVNSSLAAAAGSGAARRAAAAYLGGGAGWRRARGRSAGARSAGARTSSSPTPRPPRPRPPRSASPASPAIAVVNRGPSEQPAAAEPPAPGRGLPSVAPTPGPADPDGARRPDEGATSAGPGQPAPRTGRPALGPTRPPGHDGTSAPTPAAAAPDERGRRPAAGPGSSPARRTGAERRERPSRERRPAGPGRDGSADPEPHRSPTRSPSRRPPSPTPDRRPRPSRPPGPDADVGVERLAEADNGGRATGLGPGERGPAAASSVQLTATASTGHFHDRSSSCQRSGRGYSARPPARTPSSGFDANANRAADGDLHGDRADRLRRPVPGQQQRERPGVRRPAASSG